MVMLDQLVAGDHPYRRILDLIDLSHLCEPIASLDNAGRGANGFGIVTLFQCLLLPIHGGSERPRVAALPARKRGRQVLLRVR